jgi:predicted nucleotidyltransferase component of viral defense system
MGGTTLKLSKTSLKQLAADTGFRPDSLEKVTYLLNLLNDLNTDDFLETRIALKGGTALNLFVFDMPRLSVDIDLNYIGSDKETMLQDAERIGSLIPAIASRLNLAIRRSPSKYAGGKYIFAYESALGGNQTIQLDINYLFRVPLFPVIHLNSKQIGTLSIVDVPVVSRFELSAGKIIALFARTASRDLYDTYRLLENLDITNKDFRLAYLCYAAMNEKDWREISIKDIQLDIDDLKNQLIPMLHGSIRKGITNLESFGNNLISSCQTKLSGLFPLAKEEIEFFRLLREEGKIQPELLTDNKQLQDQIASMPGITWRAKIASENAKK